MPQTQGPNLPRHYTSNSRSWHLTCEGSQLNHIKTANTNSVSGPTHYEINLIKNKSLLRRGKSPATLMHIKCCSQLALFLWTSQGTSRWEIINVLIKLVLHASVEPFSSAKFFPLQPKDAPQRRTFFSKDHFSGYIWGFMTSGRWGWRRSCMKRTISLYPYLHSLREWVWFLDSPPSPIRGIKSLLPLDETYGAMRGLRDQCKPHHPILEHKPSICKNSWHLQSLRFSLINLVLKSSHLTAYHPCPQTSAPT